LGILYNFELAVERSITAVFNLVNYILYEAEARASRRQKAQPPAHRRRQKKKAHELFSIKV
jgi:hypothetical protein